MRRVGMVDIIWKQLQSMEDQEIWASHENVTVDRKAAEKLLEVLEKWQMKRVVNDRDTGKQKIGWDD